MLNVFPRATGVFVARHVKISYSAAVELAYLAFWNGLSLRREVSVQPGRAGLRSIVLRDGGLSIHLERHFDHLDLRIARDGRAHKVARDLTDMREVLEKIRTAAENYQRTRRSW